MASMPCCRLVVSPRMSEVRPTTCVATHGSVRPMVRMAFITKLCQLPRENDSRLWSAKLRRIPRRRSLLTGRCGTDRHCYEKDPYCRRGNRSFDWPDLICVSPDRNQGIVRFRNRRRGSMDQSDSWRQFDRIRTGLLAGPQHAPRVLRDVDLQLLITMYLIYLGDTYTVGILLWPAVTIHAAISILLVRMWWKDQRLAVSPPV